jgi:hypothetical protein
MISIYLEHSATVSLVEASNLLWISYLQSRVFVSFNFPTVPRVTFLNRTWARHEKLPEVDRQGCGTLRYTLSQKHQSTYLHNRKRKLGINDSTSSVNLSVNAVFINH